MVKPDYSSRDWAGKVCFYVLLWKRKDLDLEAFGNYWKDVHGPVCARLPGQFQYWQFHVGHNKGSIWPLISNPINSSHDRQQIDGIAELTFNNVADRQLWFQASKILMDDERNIFSKAIGYNTSPGNSITIVDHINDGDPNFSTVIKKLHILIRKSKVVNLSDFRNFLKERLARVFLNSEQVLKCRIHLFDQMDDSRPEAGPVSHTEASEDQYHAAIELAFSDALQMNFFIQSTQYQFITKDLEFYCESFYPFPERSAHTFVYDSKMTLSGQRGSTVASLITSLGAANQLAPSIIDLITGNPLIDRKSDNDLDLKLPGTNADLVKALFARGECFDSQGFSDFFTDSPIYHFGNYPICFDKQSIFTSTTNFFGAISALYHNIKNLWEFGDIVFVEMDVTYWRKDGTQVTLPCMDIVRFEGTKIADLRIFMDANPVGNPSIPVSDSASLRIISEGKFLPVGDMMRSYFANHPGGKALISLGYMPKWATDGSRWSINDPIPTIAFTENSSLSHSTVNTIKPPGTNSELVKALFARGESFDPDAFCEFFTEKPVYQFGNYPICFDKNSIRESTKNFFSMVSALYHDIKMLWEIGETVFVEMDVIYWRKDGTVVTLPCMDIVRFEGDKISELRICMDANPVGDSSIQTDDTSRVKVLNQSKRIPLGDVMRNYFTETLDGQNRVSLGYIPKWSIAGPKWPLSNPNNSSLISTMVNSSDGLGLEKWEQVKTYLKTFVSDQLETLISQEIQKFGN